MSSTDAAGNTSRWSRLKNRIGMAVAAAAVIGACLAIRAIRGPHEVDAKPPAAANSGVRQASATAAIDQKPQIVALVNNEEIGRQELARECLTHYGKEVLESMVNKYLITQYCQQQGVTVSRQEVNDEIDRLARKFNLTADQWVKMLQQERGLTPEQYANDIVWPTLALKKLAAERLKPTPQELQEAFDSQFGEAVKARIIVVGNQQLAEKLVGEAKADPANFGKLANKYSIDASASSGGLIPPIHRHIGDKQLEDVAFQLQVGEVSSFVPVGNQFIILKCEDRLPPSNADIDQVKDRLAEAIRDKKLRTEAADIFSQLQKQAVLQNVFNDPVKSQQMPGVAATINDHKITIRDLAEECIDRHGTEVLDGTINRHLLEQAIRTERLSITQQDIDAEVDRAAEMMGKLTPDKRPDRAAWLDTVTKEQGITVDIYLHDAVWPSVALKKLVGEVEVAPEDYERGFEANYGKRVRCRAIVMNNQRKAQEVWETARRETDKEPDKQKRPDVFGRLAEQYSIDPSKSIGGQVPPIQRFGGAPKLEEEAYKLQPGDLSSIVEIGSTFVILYCEGFTEPQKITLNEVKNQLKEDIHEKKMRLAMAERFNRLKESAEILNYLSGTSQIPKRVGTGPAAGAGPTAGRSLPDAPSLR